MTHKNSECTDEQQAHLLKVEQKSWGKWCLYAVTGILPVALGIISLMFLCIDSKPTIVPPQENYITKAIPFFFVFILLELLVGIIMNQKLYRLNDTVNSLSMGILSTLIDVVFGSFPILPYTYLHNNYAIIRLEENWTTWWLLFFCVEYGYYWFHRFAHEWNIGWASHIVHHSSEEYNLSTALRQGFVQSLISWIFYLPFAFFFPVPLFSFHKQFNTLYQFWIHTRAIGKLGPLEWILNTPSHHRVHHGKNPKYIDKNYGGTLIIFDRIFGTFEPEQEEVVYGITHKINTWDPIWHQIHQWYEIWEACKKTKGFWNKIRVWCDLGPGYNWRILNYERFIKNPVWKNIDPKKVKKYDQMVEGTSMWLYILQNLVSILVYVYLLVLVYDRLDVRHRIIYVSYVTCHLVILGALMDKKSWSYFGEVLRLCAALVLILNATTNKLIVFGMTMYSLVSIIWIFWTTWAPSNKKHQGKCNEKPKDQ